jgi:outer membrane lipoprotein SlyB
MLTLVGLAIFVPALTGCAPAGLRAGGAPPTPLPASLDSGVIVSLRPMTVTASNAVLVALNQDALSRAARPAAAVELTIRQDGGRTVSVVQQDAAAFRPGDRVRLTGGPRTRVVLTSG